ncbi:GL16818 [Drosophila persimilis]|uniref:trypsin n=1 Tax=Drosophila persimilis TaxID=7234 RepID=B4GI62_DROPE|nr:trypsin beta [Drosophila persimilis]EDW36182.1 GL16818 [Drosophila persimilis]
MRCSLEFAFGLSLLLVALEVGKVAPTPASDGRIVGGMEVSTIGEFPYQASVQLNGQHICGGAVIGDHFVLTAAHCFEDLEPWSVLDYSVRVGSSEHASGGQLLSLQRIIPHGGYNPQSHDNDLALLILNARLNFTEHLQAVPLASAQDPKSRTRLLVSGWGFQSEEAAGEQQTGAGVASVLRFVEVDHVDIGQCRLAYRQVLPITQGMLCAARDGHDSCQGDSGGPLVGIQEDGSATLYGIVSWGLGCANPDYPGVYTSVTAFRRWIDAQVGAWGWNGLLAGWSGLQ